MSHIAHDLNNHIAALLSFADLVLDELSATDAMRPRIEMIRTLGNRVVIKSTPDSARVAQVAGDVAQLRGLVFSTLADADLRSPIHADLVEIAMAAEQAHARLSVVVDARVAA